MCPIGVTDVQVNKHDKNLTQRVGLIHFTLLKYNLYSP